jgi:hypothetical protein
MRNGAPAAHGQASCRHHPREGKSQIHHLGPHYRLVACDLPYTLGEPVELPTGVKEFVTLLGQSPWFISHALLVRVTRGMSAISLLFKHSLPGRLSTRH